MQTQPRYFMTITSGRLFFPIGFAHFKQKIKVKQAETKI